MILLPMEDLWTHGESTGEYAGSGWFSVARSCRSSEWMPGWQNGRDQEPETGWFVLPAGASDSTTIFC